MSDIVLRDSLAAHLSLFKVLPTIEPVLAASLQVMRDALLGGKKILIAGNGGSAADAQHFAAELVGRFNRDRRALPCIALTTDTSNLTAIGNDFGYDKVFGRQIEGIGNAGDVFVGISTSGNSLNIIKAIKIASVSGISTIGLLGNDGGKLHSLVQIPVIVPHVVTARIQEAHIFILHYWAEILERDCA